VNKFSILLFIVILVIFGGLFFVLQGNMFKKTTDTQSPVIPSDDGTLKLVQQQPQQQVQPQSSASAQAQQPAPTFGVAEGVKASYSAVIKTSKGDITLTLYGKYAPNTVKNFITKAQSGYYNGLIFHRVENWVIQGGDPKGDGTGGGVMRTELNDIPFGTGSLGVARGQDINVSNDSQFFITKSDAAWLNQQYTNFGQVTSGMDVVGKIEKGDKILGITVE
jgi:peptidyl-prolyl cis-trans isomerase B (cyclophilin B)